MIAAVLCGVECLAVGSQNERVAGIGTPATQDPRSNLEVAACWHGNVIGGPRAWGQASASWPYVITDMHGAVCPPKDSQSMSLGGVNSVVAPRECAGWIRLRQPPTHSQNVGVIALSPERDRARHRWPVDRHLAPISMDLRENRLGRRCPGLSVVAHFE
ncbi:MAG: hypothetical protein Q8P38_06325 [Candidatus Nanopelagicales bacterium]|nr:hypothetical protein [Candidatus Nanopelagicales bacterium]